MTVLGLIRYAMVRFPLQHFFYFINPVVFKTNAVIFRANPVICRTNSVIFRANPVILRTNPVRAVIRETVQRQVYLGKIQSHSQLVSPETVQ